MAAAWTGFILYLATSKEVSENLVEDQEEEVGEDESHRVELGWGQNVQVQFRGDLGHEYLGFANSSKMLVSICIVQHILTWK